MDALALAFQNLDDAIEMVNVKVKTEKGYVGIAGKIPRIKLQTLGDSLAKRLPHLPVGLKYDTQLGPIVRTW